MTTHIEKITLIFLTLTLSIPTVEKSFAEGHVGTITQIEGDVTLFTRPSNSLSQITPEKSPSGSGERALFEGEYYWVKKAQTGDKLENGNIIRTTPAAKARVIYSNGDQFNVGPGSTYRVKWTENSGMRMEMPFGKVRGIIEKGGPRSHLKIRTRTAVMGVRGTDFFVDANGKTEVSVVRGQVEVTPVIKAKKEDTGFKELVHDKVEAKAPPVQLVPGYTAEVEAVPEKPKATVAAKRVPEPAPVFVRKTTQQDIQTIVSTAPPVRSENRSIASSSEGKKILALEEKAKGIALKDIQKSNQALYKSIDGKDSPALNANAVNDAALREIAKDAPKEKAVRKPAPSEVENIQDGAYEKYFKPAE